MSARKKGGRQGCSRVPCFCSGALSSAPVCVLTKEGHITWQSRAQILGELNRSEFKSKPCHLLAGRAGAEKPTPLSLSSLIHEVSIIAVPTTQSLARAQGCTQPGVHLLPIHLQFCDPGQVHCTCLPICETRVIVIPTSQGEQEN